MSAKLQVHNFDVAPRGPLNSQIVQVGDLLYLSGRAGRRPNGTVLPADDIAAQTRQALANLTVILKAAGCGWDRVVKITILTTRHDSLEIVDEALAGVIGTWRPAATRVVVESLADPAFGVEIDAIAAL